MVHLVPRISLWRYHTRQPTPNFLAAPWLGHNTWASRLYIRNQLYLQEAWGGPAPCLFISDAICFYACSPWSSLQEKQIRESAFLLSKVWTQGLNENYFCKAEYKCFFPQPSDPEWRCIAWKIVQALGTRSFRSYRQRKNSLSIWRMNFFDY